MSKHSKLAIHKGLLKKNEKKLSHSSIFTFRYINDVTALNNLKLVILVSASIPLNVK